MKAEYDLSKMKSRRNPYASKLKQSVTIASPRTARSRSSGRVRLEQMCAWEGFMQGSVPHEVVNLSFERGVSAMAAWREHLGLTQAEVAARIGITQAAYAQRERVKQPRKATLEKVASALGLEAEQLRW
jgi:DNA-binding XRE family transcriptional regulator